MFLVRNFNQRFSVRRADEFGSPRIIPLEQLQLPRGAILHTFDPTGAVIAPPSTLPFFGQLERPALVRHHFRLNEARSRGRFRGVPVQGQDRKILAYHRDNRKFRRAADSSQLEKADIRQLIIENYTPIIPHYDYADEQLAPYNRCYNFLATMISQLAEDAANFERQNYVMVEIPATLPAYLKFLNTYNDRSINRIEPFTEHTMLLLLELFGWFRGDSDSGMFNGLTLEQLSRINIIFTHNTGFSNLNLGTVELMRKDAGGRLTNDQITRKFYGSLIHIMTSAPEFEAEAQYVTPEGDKMEIVDVDVRSDSQTYELDLGDDSADDDLELDSEEAAAPAVPEFNEEQDIVTVAEVEDVKPTEIVVEKTIDHNAIIRQEIEKLAKIGRLSAASYKKLNEVADNLNTMPSPYNPDKTYADDLVIDEKLLEVEPVQLMDSPKLLNKDWAMNTTDSMRRRYDREILHKDVMAAVASAQRLGLLIHDHQVTRYTDVSGTVEQHVLRIQPIFGDIGEPVTVHFRIPAITEDGTWITNGTEYNMRPQRVDQPIRKVKPDTVALTTGYGKNFVTRSSAVANDYGTWLSRSLTAKMLASEDREITNADMGNAFDPKTPAPLDYCSVAQRFRSFHAKGLIWSFDISKVAEMFPAKDVEYCATVNMTPVAKTKGYILAMDSDSVVHKVVGEKTEVMGSLPDVLGLPSGKRPTQFTQLGVMGKEISLGFIFSYYLGLAGMLEHFGIKYEIVPPTARIDKTKYTAVLKLADAKYLINCNSRRQEFIVNGLQHYAKHLVQHTEAEMNRQDVYFNILNDADKLTVRYLQELDRMRKGFVDDMHARLLRRMGEPVTFIGLLERSNEMLLTARSEDEICREEMLFLGNQRIAYHVFTGLVRAARAYESAPPSGRRFELTDDMIWGCIVSDPAVLQTPGANAIQPIKEKDVITMGGTGGRTDRTLTAPTRKFQKSDLGVVSGDTVDNGSVGAISYSVSNPEYATVDGFTKPANYADGFRPAEMLSFVNGLVPDILTDDGKRRNFVHIQLSSATTFDEAVATPYRTGVEALVAHRTSVKHARVLEKPAKVTKVTDKSIEVKYDDGTVSAYPLGKWFGHHEGTTYPHENVTRWKVGDKLPARAVLTYNKHQFEPDVYDPYQVNFKNGRVVQVALLLGEEVHEDSNAISEELAGSITCRTTKPKDVTMRFDQVIYDIHEEGDVVDMDTILCTFSDALVGSSDPLSARSTATLSALSNFTPTSGVRGVIDKIEVIYNGDVEDMSDSIRKLVKKYDKSRKLLADELPGHDVAVDGSAVDYRVNGVPVGNKELVIFFYITTSYHIASDKLVVANQLKTTTQEIMRGVNTTEDGRKFDLKFGTQSVDARIVGSVTNIGTTLAVSMRGGDIIGSILDGDPIVYDKEALAKVA